MKLSEYLKQFEGMDPEAEVYFQMADGCCGDTFTLDDPEIDQCKEVAHGKFLTTHYLTVRFPALDFLRSCRRSGAAKRAGGA